MTTATRRRRASDRILHGLDLEGALRLAHVGTWHWETAAERAAYSREARRILGLRAGERRPLPSVLAGGEEARALERAWRDALRRHRTFRLEVRLTRAGRLVYAIVEGEPDLAPGGEALGLRGTVQDVTELSTTAVALRESNRLLRTLQACGEVLVHAEDEAHLLHDMCGALVETGGYRLAWIGYAEPDLRRTVRVVAAAGAAAYARDLDVSWGDNPRGRGPTGVAIRTGRIQLLEDTEAGVEFAPWREAARRYRFRSSIALPLPVGGRVLGALNIYAPVPHAFDEGAVDLLREFAQDVAYGIGRLRDLEKLNRSLELTIQAVATTAEMHDPHTAGHQRRVAELARAIAERMRLPAYDVRGIHIAAGIHDIGKINVPAELLARPARLTPDEYELVKSHAHAGYQILSSIEFPWPIAEMILQHHERLDGSGYPLGLRGEAIMLGARVLAVADVVEAMSSPRPHRAAGGPEAVLAELHKHRAEFDEAVVAACQEVLAGDDSPFRADRSW